MTKTILVTGCAGFIGSHLCEYLFENEDCHVIGIDNFLTGSRENISRLLTNKNFQFLEGDIIEPIEFKEKIDQIYNLACPASPTHYQRNAIQTIKSNTTGVINLLELAKKNNARILQASTSEIYGDPLENPQKETYFGNVNPIGPRACYDEGKRIAETLFFEYYRKDKVDIRVARIFNTYGPQMAESDGRVVSNLIIQALKGGDLTIYGNGQQTRSFCYISDMIKGLYKLMNSSYIGPVNLGNPEEITIMQIAEQIIAETKSKSKIITEDLPENDPKRRQPDITVANKELNWTPEVARTEGLQKTIEYFKDILKK